MARRNECYVDTSALIAFLDQSDSFHALFRRLFSEPPSLVTSARDHFSARAEAVPTGPERETYRELAAEENEHVSILETELKQFTG